MIYIDASELRSTSRLARHLDDLEYQSVPDLESRTGADLMITRQAIPITDALLPFHIKDGCLFIQLKFGNDLASSFGGRLHEAIHRMYSLGTLQYQRVLVFVGQDGCNRKHNLTINGRQAVPKKTCLAIHTAIRHWNRFGVYHPISRESMVAEVLKSFETSLYEPAREEFWPQVPKPEDFEEPVDELTPPQPVKDWRLTIATFPGVGPKKANNLKQVMEAEKGQPPTLMSALQWATLTESERKLFPKIPLWGDKTFDSCREWLFGEKAVKEYGDVLRVVATMELDEGENE